MNSTTPFKRHKVACAAGYRREAISDLWTILDADAAIDLQERIRSGVREFDAAYNARTTSVATLIHDVIALADILPDELGSFDQRREIAFGVIFGARAEAVISAITELADEVRGRVRIAGRPECGRRRAIEQAHRKAVARRTRQLGMGGRHV